MELTRTTAAKLFNEPVMKSWMAAMSGSPFLGVTRLDFTFKKKHENSISFYLSTATVGQQSDNSRTTSDNSRSTVGQRSDNGRTTVGQQSASSRIAVGQQSNYFITARE